METTIYGVQGLGLGLRVQGSGGVLGFKVLGFWLSHAKLPYHI